MLIEAAENEIKSCFIFQQRVATVQSIYLFFAVVSRNRFHVNLVLLFRERSQFLGGMLLDTKYNNNNRSKN